jgi:hypothetical protein
MLMIEDFAEFQEKARRTINSRLCVASGLLTMGIGALLTANSMS